MKKKLTIRGIFNDQFTNYEDKEDSYSIIVDPEEDCECSIYRKCGMCKFIEKYKLTDL